MEKWIRNHIWTLTAIWALLILMNITYSAIAMPQEMKGGVLTRVENALNQYQRMIEHIESIKQNIDNNILVLHMMLQSERNMSKNCEK